VAAIPEEDPPVSQATGYHNDVFSTIRNRMLDWLSDVANEGNNITDLATDLLNRAQRELWEYRAWEYLLESGYSLTISSKAATLPSDFGRMVRVWHDTDGDNRPDFYYYNRSNRVDDGYYIVSGFTKAAGHTWTINFYNSPTQTVKIDYIKTLEDFTGTGTEYSFFPGELLLCTAQKIHITESDMIGPEYSAMRQRQLEMLANYEHANHYVNVDMRLEVVDDAGDRVETEEYDLGQGVGAIATNFDNSYDLRG